MKRICLYLTFFVLVIVGLSCAVPVSAGAATERDWLILVYISGVNDRGINGHVKGLINQLENAGSNEKTAIVVKFAALEAGKDRELIFPRVTKTLLIADDKGDPEITSAAVESSPILDMASETSLFLFVRKGLLKYPSKKAMLILAGKGEGYRGALDDDLSGNRMGVNNIAGALSRVQREAKRRLDILVLDADLMQMAETVYGLKEAADFIVASEEAATGNHYVYDLALREAMDDPTISARNLSDAIVYFADDPVSSIVRADKIEPFMKLLDRWSVALMDDQAALKAAALAVDKTFGFAMKDSKDLIDFIDCVTQALPPDSTVVQAGRDLKRYVLQDLVVSTHRAADQKTPKNRLYGTRAHGLAIYLPDLSYDSQTYHSLAFASASQWPNLLLKMLEERRKK